MGSSPSANGQQTRVKRKQCVPRPSGVEKRDDFLCATQEKEEQGIYWKNEKEGKHRKSRAHSKEVRGTNPRPPEPWMAPTGDSRAVGLCPSSLGAFTSSRPCQWEGRARAQDACVGRACAHRAPAWERRARARADRAPAWEGRARAQGACVGRTCARTGRARAWKHLRRLLAVAGGAGRRLPVTPAPGRLCRPGVGGQGSEAAAGSGPPLPSARCGPFAGGVTL